MPTFDSNGVSEQVGLSPAGYPVHLWRDPSSPVLRYVVRMPDGRFELSDPKGVPLSSIARLDPIPAGMLGAAVGAFIGGPVGALIGSTALFAIAAIGKKSST